MKSKKGEPSWYAVWHLETGECLEVIDAEDACIPYAGMDYTGHCGGCGNCLLMQADYYEGVESERVILQGHETLGTRLVGCTLLVKTRRNKTHELQLQHHRPIRGVPYQCA